MLRLASGDSELLLCPDTGGAVARFTWCGLDILRPASDADIAARNARLLGMFPLAPYSNRLEDGLLSIPNGAHQLRLNVAGEPHSMHGFAWQRPWRVAAAGADWARLTLPHPDDSGPADAGPLGGDGDWPFRCNVELVYHLNGSCLRAKLTLTNDDQVPMPAGLGFHPYFPRDAQTCLQADWDGCWEMDKRKLPTSWRPRAEADNFNALRAIDGWAPDHCFTGWDRSATLVYPTHATTVSADADCSRLICFVPDDGRQFVALEPVTHSNNAFNLAGRGIPGTGMQVLEPGASLVLEMAITVGATVK
jgi:aldose 1-epimerase